MSGAACAGQMHHKLDPRACKVGAGYANELKGRVQVICAPQRAAEQARLLYNTVPV